MTITELAIKRPTLIVVIFSFLGVLGIFGFMQLNYDLMPKMTAPMITISTVYPGASPYEVETSVTKLIEDAVTGLEKVSSVRSSSTEGFSFIFIEFDMDVNVNLALQDAERKINEAASRLPTSAKKPVVSKLAFDEIPVLRMAARANLPSKEFYQFLKDKVQPRIAKIEGVGLLSFVGGDEREIKIYIDFRKLRGYGLSLLQVTNAIKGANLDFPTGRVKENGDQFTVRVAGKFTSLEQVREQIVGRSKTGGDIALKDIAEVVDGSKEITKINRLNGLNSVGLVVQKTSDANTVEVSEKVRLELGNLEKEYSKQGLKFDIAQDASTFIMASANAVKEDLLLAIILVALVMLLFLHSLRNSLIVMVAIPASLISTFFIMYMAGFSLNMMTLLAMSLVIGILVDDSIVVLENIYRHLEMGKGQKEAALTGRNEIGFAALSITFVDVVVFVPLALIVGMIGNFLREYSLVVVFSTLMSLFVSFTITPLLASRFTRLEHLTKNTLMGRFGLWFEKLFGKFTSFYISGLKWSLKHGITVFALVSAGFIISIFLFPLGFIGMEFIPSVDRGEMIFSIELDPGASVEQTNYTVTDVERIISSHPEVEKVLSNIGSSSEGMMAFATSNMAEIYVTLVDKNKRNLSTEQFGMLVKGEIQKLPGIKVRVTPVSLMGTSNRSPVQFLVTGTSYEDVLKGSKIIADVIKSIEGSLDVRLSAEEGKPELRVDIDRIRLARLGLSISEIGQNLRIALTGDDDSKYREGVNEYDIRIQLDEFDRTKTDVVSNYTFMNSKGQYIELSQFANVYQTTGPTKLERENRMPAINVYSQVFGKTSGVLANEVIAKLEKDKAQLGMPPGVAYRLTGEQKTMQESFMSLLAAVFAGILFVYLIMVALYDSYLYPFVVLFSIPLAMVGAFFGLALTAKSMSIYSILGIIMLIGLVAKNAILLVDRTNQMRKENGMTTYDALIEAGQTRLRPILMTTFSMIVGMLPIALSTAAGGEAKSGLAMVLIGGLTSSMILTLIVVPVVYQRFDKWKTRLMKKKTSELPIMPKKQPGI